MWCVRCVTVCGSTCTTSRVVSGQVLPLLCCCTISDLMISCTVKTSVITLRELWKILVPFPLILGVFRSSMCRSVSLWVAGAFIWCMSSGPTSGTVRKFRTISFETTQLVAVETKLFIILSQLWFTALHLITIC